MTPRYVTVGDDLQLPPAVKAGILTSRVRTNACKYPISDTVAATTGWLASNGAISLGSGYLRNTLSTATATRGLTGPNGTTQPVAAPGVTYTFQCQMRCSASVNARIDVRFYASDGTTALGSATVNGTPGAIGPGGWVTLPALTTLSPASTAFAKIMPTVSSGTSVIGDTLDLRHVLYESASAVDTYFDGTTTGTGVTYAWTGTAQLSTSTATYAPLSSAQTVSAAATDAATTQTLANSLRSALIALGIVT